MIFLQILLYLKSQIISIIIYYFMFTQDTYVQDLYIESLIRDMESQYEEDYQEKDEFEDELPERE